MNWCMKTASDANAWQRKMTALITLVSINTIFSPISNDPHLQLWLEASSYYHRPKTLNLKIYELVDLM